MIPLKNKIIVRVAMDQKETITYGTLKLVIPHRKELNINGREANPVLAEVVEVNDDSEHLEKGAVVILHHNTFENTALTIAEHDGVRTLVIPVDRWVIGKLDDKGDLLPLNGNVLVERIYEQDVSSIIVTPDNYKKYEANKVTVVSAAPDVKNIEAGDMAVIMTYGDYQVHYAINGENKSPVIVFVDDIMGVEKRHKKYVV